MVNASENRLQVIFRTVYIPFLINRADFTTRTGISYEFATMYINQELISCLHCKFSTKKDF